MVAFIRKCSKEREFVGPAEAVPISALEAIRQEHARSGTKTRELSRIWDRRKKVAGHVEELHQGKAGGVYKKSSDAGNATFAKSQGIRASAGVGERLQDGYVYDKVKATFQRWRLGCQYVDKQELLHELVREAKLRTASL